MAAQHSKPKSKILVKDGISLRSCKKIELNVLKSSIYMSSLYHIMDVSI